MLAVVLLIVVILIALGVHSCQVSATNSALKDYTNHVDSLITESNNTGSQLFSELSGGGGSSNATSLQSSINGTLSAAEKQFSNAEGYGAPSQVTGANTTFVQAMRMRRDGLRTIATQIQPALGTSASQTAVNSIAGAMAYFYSSDALYKGYTAPSLASALHAAGIAVGGNGVSISGGQFLPSIEWLQPDFIAGELHVTLPHKKGGKVAPGLHGHSLNSVSVAGTTLQTGSTNTITASPPPSFTVNITNGGTNNETDVVVKVSVTGTSASGQTTVPETFAGQTTNVTVKLTSSPPKGTQTVVATVEPVPGEKNTSNNTLSFPVSFQ